MKILHVASFNGNIGDNANHNGLRSILRHVCGPDIYFDELEIRRFYRNYDGEDKWSFDDRFVDLANDYDLVIVGGGNFFEIWLEESTTGCTIDMPDKVVHAISTKILFYGLGFDLYKGYSLNTLSRFKHFMNVLHDKENVMVTVRNDGSVEQYIKAYHNNDLHLIEKVWDGGFFIDIDDKNESMLESNNTNVVISLAQDMPDIRFGVNSDNSSVRFKESFVKNIALYVSSLCATNLRVHVTFMPHIYSDLSIVASVLNELPDCIRRNNISVGPCMSGTGKESTFFAHYRDADLVVGMRFHANVCAMGLGVASIGLNSYKKISDLYRDVGCDNFIDVNDKDFVKKLLNMSKSLLFDPPKIFDRQRAFSIVSEKLKFFIYQ